MINRREMNKVEWQTYSESFLENISIAGHFKLLRVVNHQAVNSFLKVHGMTQLFGEPLEVILSPLYLIFFPFLLTFKRGREKCKSFTFKRMANLWEKLFLIYIIWSHLHDAPSDRSNWKTAALYIWLLSAWVQEIAEVVTSWLDSRKSNLSVEKFEEKITRRRSLTGNDSKSFIRTEFSDYYNNFWNMMDITILLTLSISIFAGDFHEESSLFSGFTP